MSKSSSPDICAEVALKSQEREEGAVCPRERDTADRPLGRGNADSQTGVGVLRAEDLVKYAMEKET